MRCGIAIITAFALLPRQAVMAKKRQPQVSSKQPHHASASGIRAIEVDNVANSAGDAHQLLQQARDRRRSLEYERIIPLVTAALKTGELSTEEQLEAYVLQGSALAVIGRALDAEEPFRLLLRVRPKYDLDQDTSPVILRVFRKVQVEEQRLRRTAARIEHDLIVKSLAIMGELPNPAPGGKTLELTYQLRDPRGAVRAMSIDYRTSEQDAFSALALHFNQITGRWEGNIPAGVTANDTGGRLQYYLVTRDESHTEMLTRGDNEHPLSLTLLPGHPDDGPPLYQSPLFWTLTGSAVVAATTVAILALLSARKPPQGSVGQVYHLPQ